MFPRYQGPGPGGKRRMAERVEFEDGSVGMNPMLKMPAWMAEQMTRPNYIQRRDDRPRQLSTAGGKGPGILPPFAGFMQGIRDRFAPPNVIQKRDDSWRQLSTDGGKGPGILPPFTDEGSRRGRWRQFFPQFSPDQWPKG